MQQNERLYRDFEMTPQSPHHCLMTCRWLKAVTIMLGVMVGLTAAMTSASALQSVSEEHSCCCDSSAKDKSNHEAASNDGCEHQAAKAAHESKPCEMAGPSKDCQCRIDSDGSAPAGESVALSASTSSFAPAVAATLHPQLDIPLARAPSAVSSDWLYGHSPPEHLYLIHQTFLI